ncbi:MAG: Ni/Fe hydrogenase subunit alpha [Thermodesulfobacteriota bacterium]|jgi:coenzyme F420-reducing hydrogenase alpha subunit|nr:MAG: Ni/Fe hydrogenase subunit alpha [Thermodesulfobacteriota bacterium]
MNGKKVIQIHHVTRIEGHGNIDIQIKDGKVDKCQWQIVEAPRFFEAALRGRKWNEAAHITSRICAICSIGHTLCSLKATEAALGITISEQTLKLRKLLINGETLQSHILHLGYLVVPDLVGAPSVIPLASTHPAEVLLVVRLHRLANEMSDLIGGRTIHPQRPVVGGFAKWPTVAELENLYQKLESAQSDVMTLAGFVKGLAPNFPKFSRETEYIGLTHPTEYAFYEGEIASTDGGKWPVDNYKSIVNEYLVPHSTAKFARHKRDAYMVGALARFNLNYNKLLPGAKKLADDVGLKPINFNPFMNNVAQLVEVAHAFEDSMQLTKKLLEKWDPEEKPIVSVKAGLGSGSVEVPRGILFHEYEYNKDGEIVWANCVIPTNQNHANIQKDMEALVEEIKERPQEEIELMVEMLVRAYDPCVSCSTH